MCPPFVQGCGLCDARIATVIILRLSIWVGRVGPRPVDGEIASLTSSRERLETVRQVLTEVPLIDGHNDLPWNIRNFVHNQLAEFEFDKDLRQVVPWSKSAWSQTDLPRLRQGMVGGQVGSRIFLFQPLHDSAFSPECDGIRVFYSTEFFTLLSYAGRELRVKEWLSGVD